MKRGMILAAVAVLGLVALPGCVNREAQAQAARTREILSDKSVLVSVAPVSTGEMAETLVLTGQMVAQNDTQVGAKVSGRLIEVLVKDGDRVTAGQLLAKQGSSDSTARLRQAIAALAGARAQYQNALATAKQGPVRTSANVEAAIARLKQAQAQYDKVKAGARAEERAQVKAAVESARTNMEVARTEMQRDQELLKQGAVAASQADRSRAAYAQALAVYEQALDNERMIQIGARSEDLAAAEQQVRAAEQSLRDARAQKGLDVQFNLQIESARAAVQSAEEQVTIAQQAVNDNEIRAPFSGQVSGRPTQVGTMLAPGSVVVRIVGSEVYFEADVPESRLTSVVPGSTVRITTQATGSQQFIGTLVAVNPVGTDAGRNFRARVSVGADAEKLRAGMFGRGEIELGKVSGAIVIPERSIIRDGDTTVVYTTDGKVAKLRTVKVLRTRDSMAQVTGIEVGEQLVVRGQDLLRDGSTVKVQADDKKGA